MTGSYTFTDGPAWGNWSVLGNAGFSSGESYYNALVLNSNDVPYVAYRDYANNLGLSVMRFSGSVWEIVGKVNAFDNAAVYISMAMGNNGNYPYISFADHSYSDRLSVATFDVWANKWIYLGPGGFSDSSISTLSPLVMDSNNVPYIVYQDWTYGNRISVKKYDAGQDRWNFVGDPGFSPDRAGYVSIAIGSGNIPYVAFQDSQVDMVSVMKYDAGQNKWIFVWQQWFTSKSPVYSSIKIDNNGVPYVLYADKDYDYNLCVMKYDAWMDKWSFLGNKWFTSGGVADIPSFAINSNNVPYVSYQNKILNNKATVMTYDSWSNQWIALGTSWFSADGAIYTSLDFDSNDVPYVTFQDKSATMKATVMNYSEVAATSGNYLYQWYRNGVAITWATGIDYIVTIDDLDKTISFEVLPYSSTFVPGVPVQSNITVPGPICGNGLIEIFETCDEGDAVNGQLGHCNLTCNGTTTQIVGNGGAGATVVSQDQCPSNRDCSSSYYDSLCGPCSETGTSHASASGDITDSSYSDELNQAYQRSFAHGITTMATIQKANMEGLLIRSHMAKMISNFAIKVLDKKPDTTLSCLFADTNNESAEMKFYIKTACQLGLMGRESDGKTTKKNFEPAGIITRAQFATVLSRLLYGDTYNSSDFAHRYTKHLQALHTKGIINDISTPNANEIRGYLMLMLMRAQK